MPETGLLIGPQRLDRSSVETLSIAALPGAYALGRMDGRTFVVKYVGRADDDLRGALLAHADTRKYRAYMFDYFGVARNAFERECAIYHDFGAWWLLDNKRHPRAPEGSDWLCARCGKNGWQAPKLKRGK